jgi:hypothetical protein
MNQPQSPLSPQYLSAFRFLRGVVALVIVYGLGMVLSGRVFAANLFDLLLFGPNTRGLDDIGVSYAIFAFGVLGSVLVGWMILVWNVLELAIVEDNPTTRATARRAIATSTAVWFLLDTGFSLVTGEVEHALFNIPFLTLLASPLYVMCKHDTVDKVKKKKS